MLSNDKTTAIKANDNKTTAIKANDVKAPSLLNRTTDQTDSAYGSTVAAICQNPNLSKDELFKILEAKNINIKASKSAITTGISQTIKVIRLLNQNGFLKL